MSDGTAASILFYSSCAPTGAVPSLGVDSVFFPIIAIGVTRPLFVMLLMMNWTALKFCVCFDEPIWFFTR